MRCANYPTCGSEAAEGDHLCEACRAWRTELQKASFPLKQGARDIERVRRATGGEGPLQRSASMSPQGKRKIEKEEEAPKLRRQKTEVLQATVGLVQLPILFVPFEGNFSARIIGGYQRTGNQTSTLVEKRGSDATVHRGDERFSVTDMLSGPGDMDFWSKKKGDFEIVNMLAEGKGALFDLLDELKMSGGDFYNMVVEDRLCFLGFNSWSSEANGLPEVIVLSEQLFDEFPERLSILGKFYLRAKTLGTQSNLQNMAAYVLTTAWDCYRFDSIKRADRFKKEFEETWLLVMKGAFKMACVHLSSNYTSAKSTDVDTIFESLLEFANKEDVHAILGDFNLNTFGVHGGVFPISGGFETESTGMGYQSKFATSSGSGDRLYMGGMICDPRVFLRTTLTSLGSLAVPPWFTRSKNTQFQDRVFSDHHSLYGNYLFGAEMRSLEAPRNEVGGDCFFAALKARLESTDHLWHGKEVGELRKAVIEKIAPDMRKSPAHTGGRLVYKQISDTDSAIGVWCRDLDEFLEEMGQPGRWVDDTILPFVAVGLGMKIVVQYEIGYAEFAKTGERRDLPGLPAFESGTISMKCQCNHYW
jgi:hypothetical protein